MSSTMRAPSSPIHPLEIDLVLNRIFLHLKKEDNLRRYRGVCHKWNDRIVGKLIRSGLSFQLPIRYGPKAPTYILQSHAQHLAREILENVNITLTGTATKLPFDTVVVDREFYLAGVLAEWTHFLKIHGEVIRHLKFKIRRQNIPSRLLNQVIDCEEVVSMESLRVVFSSTPNLESLNFSVRFCHYGSRAATPPIFPSGDIPQLLKLSKITIREPHEYSYTRKFLIEILSMAPNLTHLYIKPWMSQLSTFTSAINAVESKITRSLTSLRVTIADSYGSLAISNGVVWLPMPLSFFHLTTLEINDMYGEINVEWIQTVVHFQHTSLVKLILGNRKEMPAAPSIWSLKFPPVMENLKTLEINLLKFQIAWIESYKARFPALENLTFTGRENGNVNPWMRIHLMHLFPGVSGHGPSVKEFTLIGPMFSEDTARLSQAIFDTFPSAEYNFDSS